MSSSSDGPEVSIAKKRKKSGKKRGSSTSQTPAEVTGASPARVRSSRRFLILIAVAGAVLLAFVLMGSSRQPADPVWSDEHGHYHDGSEHEPTSPPSPPEGQVWSDEHGHWHDVE